MTDHEAPQPYLPIRLFIDGDQHCALIGPNLQEGTGEFGDTRAEALLRLAEQLALQDGTPLGHLMAPVSAGERLADDVLSVCIRRRWDLSWSCRGAYLHLEASELIEAIRGKGTSSILEEAGDVLFVLMSITQNEGIAWSDVMAQTRRKVEHLMDAPEYAGEHRDGRPTTLLGMAEAHAEAVYEAYERGGLGAALEVHRELLEEEVVQVVPVALLPDPGPAPVPVVVSAPPASEEADARVLRAAEAGYRKGLQDARAGERVLGDPSSLEERIRAAIAEAVKEGDLRHGLRTIEKMLPPVR